MNLLSDIESFIACLGMTISEFECEAGTPGLVSRLKRGAQPRAATEDKARSYMEAEVSAETEHLSQKSLSDCSARGAQS